MKESFWAKVLFREFTSHYITMTPAERAEDVQQSIIALTRLDAEGDSFGNKMVRWANERRESKAATASAINGALGGRPRTNPSTIPKHGKKSRVPDNKDEVVDFARDHDLDVDDCVECWEATIERGGTDAEGKTITNWWGYMMQWVTIRGINRKLKENQK